nr:hypothetical protein [Nocardia cyriacigeorgica]
MTTDVPYSAAARALAECDDGAFVTSRLVRLLTAPVTSRPAATARPINSERSIRVSPVNATFMP